MAEQVVKQEAKPRYRKTLTGTVSSDKMDKTVLVKVERQTWHKKFRKLVRVQNKVQAHDEKNEYKIGDLVQIVETRPLSKNKSWRVQKLLRRTGEVETV